MRALLVVLSLAVTWLLCGAPASAGALAVRTVTVRGAAYPFSVFVPSSYDRRRALPVVLLIHGAGGDGPGMLAVWQPFAERNGIVLAAPTLSLTAEFEANTAPQLYPAIVDAVRGEWAIDAQRVYLFGYSAGGYSVFSVGVADARYFAAGAVFASVIAPEYDGILERAERKTPFAIYLGDRDRFFTVAQARRTHDLLEAHGFPSRLLILPNADHNYGAVAGFVNADAWMFFSRYSLPDPAGSPAR